MKQTLSEFWAFLKNPSLLKLSEDKKSLKRDFLWLLLLDVAFATALYGVFYFLVEYKLIKEFKEDDIFKEYGVFVAFLLACVLAPLIEEALFRWHLRKRYATIYFMFLSFSGIIISRIDSSWICFLVFLLCLGMAIIIEIYLKKQSQTKKQLLWKKLFPLIFYFSAVFFGFVHISNFKGLTIQEPTFFFYISSQIVGGFSLGYIRIKYGLKYSILYHASFNLFALTLNLLFPNF